MHSGSPHLHPTETEKSPYLSAILEPQEGLAEHEGFGRVKSFPKTLLRLDAFLGEWLSPDYFDLITPPPSSIMMVASAKAELLRREEYTDSLYEPSVTRSGNFPGGWKGGWGLSTPGTHGDGDGDDDGPLTTLAMLGQSLPSLNRASSHSGSESSGDKASGKGLSNLSIAASADYTGYIPPTPTYAISPSGPIPPGYVAHARDACVNVDYRWDSMREPQLWGNGGEYGEEWTAMHKRFRAGLQKIISWYRNYDEHDRPGSASSSASTTPDCAENQDDHIDTVLILVTHGAGCNALIGALTDQPVLLDVGMASLTMAIRKEHIDDESCTHADSEDLSQPAISRNRSSIDIGISDDYDVKLVASTEHLRAGSSPLSTSRTQSPRLSSIPTSAYKHRYGSNTLTNSLIDGGFSLGEPANTRAIMKNGMFGGPQRSLSVASPPRSLTGLWTQPSSSGPASQEDRLSESPMVNRGQSIKDTSVVKKEKENIHAGIEEGERAAPSHEDSTRTNGQRGLWALQPPVAQTEREKGPKRRWTVNERR